MSPYGDRQSVVGHGDRVVILGALIAEALDLTELQVVKLRVACLLHDIGKIAIPETVTRKPGPLNDNEMAVMKAHPVLGAKILTELGMADQATWVRHHHERVDGTGYPDGLHAEQIPIESRILFVADAFDAITSERPYRPGRTVAQAVQEIAANAGSQFDAECAEVLERIYADLIPSAG